MRAWETWPLLAGMLAALVTLMLFARTPIEADRKSTRLNSSHRT